MCFQKTEAIFKGWLYRTLVLHENSISASIEMFASQFHSYPLFFFLWLMLMLFWCLSDRTYVCVCVYGLCCCCYCSNRKNLRCGRLVSLPGYKLLQHITNSRSEKWRSLSVFSVHLAGIFHIVYYWLCCVIAQQSLCNALSRAIYILRLC